MLTMDSCVNLDMGEYIFSNSPESCSDYSSTSPVNMGFQSDDVFLDHLSSDLDIPFLLNSGEDDIHMLNSFLDKSTDEILSEISSPSRPPSSDISQMDGLDVEKSKVSVSDFDIGSFEEKVNLTDCVVKNDECSNMEQPIIVKSENIVEMNSNNLKGNISPVVENNPIRYIQQYNVVNSPTSAKRKLSMNDIKDVTKLKRIPIEPRNLNFSNFVNNKLVVINNTKNTKIQDSSNARPHMVFLEKVPATPKIIIPPVFVKTENQLRKIMFDTSLNIDASTDPRILKRQQRKIKNRESACLSRKKKKDYLTSLETAVKDLTLENTKLRNENCQLKLKLSHYESTCKSDSNPVYLKFNGKVAVCMFFLVLGVNLNIFRLGVHDAGIISETNVPILRTHRGRNLLSLSENDTTEYNNSTSNLLPYSICPVAINQSESARLVLDLERWIGKPSNFTLNTKLHFNSSHSTKITKGKYLKRRKYILDNSLVSSHYPIERKNKRFPKMYQPNELQVFSPTVDQMYTDFFEAINRQEDTFYVVSFSDHRMLLPALHHNRTRRPKMSLIMPTGLQTNLTHSSMVSLMQIDCEVLDTRMINVNNGAIPRHFRRTGNTTSTEKQAPIDKSSKKRRTGGRYQKSFKPFFINDGSRSNENIVEYTFN